MTSITVPNARYPVKRGRGSLLCRNGCAVPVTEPGAVDVPRRLRALLLAWPWRCAPTACLWGERLVCTPFSLGRKKRAPTRRALKPPRKRSPLAYPHSGPDAPARPPCTKKLAQPASASAVVRPAARDARSPQTTRGPLRAHAKTPGGAPPLPRRKRRAGSRTPRPGRKQHRPFLAWAALLPTEGLCLCASAAVGWGAGRRLVVARWLVLFFALRLIAWTKHHAGR